MNYSKFIVLVILFCVVTSCEKYQGNPDRFATYDRLMAGMDLSCPEGDGNSEMYLRATVLNTEVCYFQGVEDRFFRCQILFQFYYTWSRYKCGNRNRRGKEKNRNDFRSS